MKKLKLLAVILLISCNSFSQKITLTERQAKSVAKDLVEGKACKEELEQTQNVLEMTETKLGLKEKVILNLENQKKELQKIDLLRIDQLDSKDKIIEETEEQLNKKRRSSTLYKIVALAGVIASSILLTK